jgi:type II restriction enzyme
MLERLTSNRNPNFFLLSYDLAIYAVTNLFVVPKHFFVPEIIERRKPLALSARRAGWTGCNILLNGIPHAGKIFLVKNGRVEPKVKVLKEWEKTRFLREEKKVTAKGWLLDVIRCIEKLGKKEFVSDDVYIFEKELRELHPDNRRIKDKIRQQLQILRDREYLRFVDRGKYQLA